MTTWSDVVYFLGYGKNYNPVINKVFNIPNQTN